ncbi:MAG: DoxX family membrane protein [Bacteroidales bacterium]|nr:DoxX family membrane protein [Bacteroidales bacterium]
MKNKVLSQIGRILFGVPFLVFGINHFIYGSKMAGMVPAFLPFHAFFIYLVGLGLILAAISLFINVKVRLSMILLSILMLIFILTIHLPGMMHGGNGAQLSMMMLLKDLGLGAAALFIAGNAES